MNDFHRQASAVFSFLVEDYGFSSAIAGDHMIVFTGPKSILRIGVGRCGDIGLTFDRLSESNYYPLSIYMRCRYPDECRVWEDRDSHSKLELEANLQDIALTLRRFGSDVIRGDPDI
ncbi:MAG: hypothetical protein WCP45_12305 [Verrucomicrobiota bacterium]